MSQSKRGVATIGDVAEQSGVSRTTISRYLNGRFEFMSEDTRKRIQATIETLNYVPNPHARSLKSNKSGFIGVSVADILSPFSSILVKGIGDYYGKRGYEIVVTNSDEKPVQERKNLTSLVDHGVDGLIVNSTGENDDFLRSLRKRGIPLVLADRAADHPDFDLVMNNNYQMTAEVVRELINRSFGRIGFFSPPLSGNRTRQARRAAFVDVSSRQLAVDAEKFVYIIDPYDPTTVSDAITQFIRDTHDAPRAAFAVNGVVLLAMIQTLVALGLSIPDDVGVLGYDDWAWAALIPPGITAIKQPTYEVGVETAKLLLSRVTAKHPSRPKQIEIPSTIVWRGSTDLTRTAVQKPDRVL
jgi:LacI family kdg operon repressor